MSKRAKERKTCHYCGNNHWFIDTDFKLPSWLKAVCTECGKEVGLAQKAWPEEQTKTEVRV